MKNTFTFIIIILIFFLGLFLGDNFGGNGNNNITTDTIYQDTGRVIIKEIPTPYKVDSLIYKDSIIYLDSLIYILQDTAQIVADYLLKRSYKLDTNINDVSISLNEIVALNKLISRNLIIKNNRATSINNIYPPKFSLIGGGGFRSNNLHLGGGFEYKNSIVIYNRNFLNEYSKHTISYYHKFYFNRKKLTVL